MGLSTRRMGRTSGTQGRNWHQSESRWADGIRAEAPNKGVSPEFPHKGLGARSLGGTSVIAKVIGDAPKGGRPGRWRGLTGERAAEAGGGGSSVWPRYTQVKSAPQDLWRIGTRELASAVGAVACCCSSTDVTWMRRRRVCGDRARAGYVG